MKWTVIEDIDCLPLFTYIGHSHLRQTDKKEQFLICLFTFLLEHNIIYHVSFGSFAAIDMRKQIK